MSLRPRVPVARKNAIYNLRKARQWTQEDLASRMGTSKQQIGKLENGRRDLSLDWARKFAHRDVFNCHPAQVLFPDLNPIEISKFQKILSLADDGEESRDPGLAISNEVMTGLLPSARNHKLRLIVVDADVAGDGIAKGDAIIIDRDDNIPSRPGLYAIMIADTIQLRYLSTTTDGNVTVQGDGQRVPNETVSPNKLKVFGRARLKVTRI